MVQHLGYKPEEYKMGRYLVLTGYPLTEYKMGRYLVLTGYPVTEEMGGT